MRKFKLFFYPIYFISLITVLYFSLDILANMDAYKEKLDMTFALRKLPIYLMASFIFLGVLMLTEVVVENFQIIRLKRKLKKAEEEVLQYKAKLYDRSTQTPAESTVHEEEAASEEAEPTEDDKYLGAGDGSGD